MKDKVIIFVIGILLGAVISTGSIYIYNVATSNNSSNQQMQMPSGEAPGGQNGQSSNGQTPPAKPGEETTNASTTSE